MNLGILGAGVLMFAATGSVAFAQDYPSRLTQIVVPAAPGGLVDILARMLATRLQERFSQPVVVENRPGASQMIGAERVAKSAGDGYTLLFPTSTYVTTAAVRSNLPFDPLNDLAGVGLVGSGPFLVVVHPSLPVRSVKDLIALVRAKPGQLLYGSSGVGSLPHLSVELLAAGAQIKMTHISYKSFVPVVTNNISGEVQLSVGSMSLLLPHANAGRLRALAVTTATRSGLAPQIATVAEAGVPGYDVPIWYGVFAPSKTPKNVITRLNGEIKGFLAQPDVKSRLIAAGAEPAFSSPQNLDLMLRNELAQWRKVVQKLQLN